MLKYLLIWFALFILYTSGFAQEAYFPVRDGLSWTYSNGETQTFSASKVVAGENTSVLVHYLQGTPISEDYLLYDANGVRSVGTSAGGQTILYTPFLTFYPAPPLEVGQAWSSSTQLPDFTLSFSAEVLAVRGISTPAGRFNALQIRQQTITSSGAQTILDLYFVPSIGVVRWVTQDGTNIDLIEKNF